MENKSVNIQVTDDRSVRNVVTAIKKKYGRLDAIVCCAGIAQNFKTFSFKREDNRNQKTFLADLYNITKVG